MKKLIYIFLGLFMMLGTQVNAQKLDRSKMPKAGPAPKINLGKPQTFTLPNGLKVMVVEDKKLPRFSISLSMDNDPVAYGAKKGVASMTSSLLGKGSTKTTKDKFEEEVDFMGAEIEIYGSGAYAAGMTRYFDRILELMAEAALVPNFSSEELEKEREKAIEGLKSNEKSAAAIAGRVTNALAYGKEHPFGEYDTEEALKGITLEDVRLHYTKYFVPGKAYMVVSGDVDFEDVKAKVTKHFELWKKATAPSISYTDPSNVQFTQINFVDVPNAVQAEVQLINTTRLKMTDPDYFPVLLANEIVGGSFESYLNKTLREEKAWTYGARSSLSASKNITSFRFNSSLKQAAIDSAVVEVLKQINKIIDNFVKDDELKNAKATFAGDFIRESSKPRTISSYALRIQTQNLPEDFYENYLSNLQKVTKEDIKRVANKYFMTNNARIVIAAKGAEVADKLEATGIPVFYFDKYGEKTEKPKVQQISADVTAKSVLEGHIKAIGGMDKAKAVKTSMFKGSMQIPGVPAPAEVTIKYGQGKFLQDVNIPGMGSVMKTKATNGKASSAQRGMVNEMEGDDLALTLATSYPIVEFSLLNQSNVKLEGIENYNEKEAYKISFGKMSYFYDVKDKLCLGYSIAEEVNGQVFNITTKFSDYKEVNGVKMPHKWTQFVGQDVDINFSEVKINEGVTDADFE